MKTPRPESERENKRSAAQRTAWGKRHEERAAIVKAGQLRRRMPSTAILCEEDPLAVFDSDEFGA